MLKKISIWKIRYQQNFNCPLVVIDNISPNRVDKFKFSDVLGNKLYFKDYMNIYIEKKIMKKKCH